ncbi:dipeptidyl-peptidase-4 [Flexibacter flexilis DSM 6793]|uniref:Dipeptidyl-peptidase-4 n=1 Tax=Flexibacter flexilis DSM 6793 TaxID=927664 RepID=A0A1I1FDY6_9BACT|nr:S9 family peptidase [Flexibacter flexilis]SFB95928.1 dipeptidyl-peptidase-4 [Flexibacter flexilis DSM 6793]
MFKQKIYALLCFSLLCVSALAQQKKQISLEDIWARRTFSAESVSGVNWLKTGRFYTSQEAEGIVKYDIATGKALETLVKAADLVPEGQSKPIDIDEYTFSADENKVLISTASEPLYRRSSKEENYVYDLKTKKLQKLSAGGKQSYATFSPDGSKVAFVRSNNVFWVDLATGKEQAVTTNGEFNNIINGACDWVYEEEFSFAKAFFWSPDNQKIAFYSFNESQVPQYNMTMWGKLYPEDYRYKYPKAGEANSAVQVAVYHLSNQKTQWVEVGAEKDQYIARVQWTKDANTLSLQRLNRLQNHLEILHADATTGKIKVVLDEKSETYIDITDDLTYLKDGKYFIFSTEKSGYKHLYLYDMNGKQQNAITAGNWEVDEIVAINEAAKTVYFTSTESSSLQRQLYSVSFAGKNKKQLTQAAGTHKINMSADFSCFLDYHTTANTPLKVSLCEANGKVLRVLKDNQKLRETLASYQISPQEFFTIKTPDGQELNASMIKPANFDASRKYPVFMHLYGGPGSQTVKDDWGGTNFLWHQLLAQKGYIIVIVDNRGTGGKGEKFKKATYANLGKYETQDQIDAAKHLSTLPFVDGSRIGIWGWSFGGYMSSLCITQGADYFKLAIAVAPVTNWRYYDSIYTERYLRTPQENAKGYDENSPVTHASKLKGKYLLVHGTGDDNVHFQNAVAMQDALIKAGKQFDSFYYPNRNHGIYGGNTRLHLYQMMTDFVTQNL